MHTIPSEHPFLGGILAAISIGIAFLSNVQNLDLVLDISAKIAALVVAVFSLYVNYKVLNKTKNK